MPRKTTAWLALFLCFQFITACATSPIRNPGAGIDLRPTKSIKASVFPEVRIATLTGAIHEGKILGITGGRVRFLPSPYWGAENEWLDIDALASISLAKPGGGGWPTVLAAFGAGFLVPGALLLAVSKYDEDYAGSIIVASGTAFISGVISYLGANRKAGWRKPLNMTGMTVPQKTQVIMSIMLPPADADDGKGAPA